MAPEEFNSWQNLEGQDRKFLRLWQIWAAKEASFKAMKRLEPSTRFLPKLFLSSPDLSTIQFHHTKMSIEWPPCPSDLIAAIVKCSSDDQVHTIIRRFESIDPLQQSSMIQQLSIDAVREHFNIPASMAICFIKDEFGIPSIEVKTFSDDFVIPVSLSHDGPYLGVAILKHQQLALS